jgi:hypothetical protein
MEKIIITPGEWKLIEHRLELTDCLAETMRDTYDWDEKDCEAKARELLRACEKQFAANNRIELDLGAMDEVTVEILKDCMDGTTYFADVEDAVALRNITRGTALAMERAAQSLEAKFSAAGHKVSIPRY